MASVFRSVKDYIHRYLPLPFFYGRNFREIYDFLEKSGKWDCERLQDYKLKKLRALLRHAEKNVPYYRDLFWKEDICSEDIRSLKDFSGLPVLTKQILRDNLESMKAKGFASYDPIRTETSGTTGFVAALYRSRYQEDFRNAVLWRIYHKYGFKFGDRMLSLTGECYCRDDDSPLYDHDRITNRIVTNMHYIISGKSEKVVDLIERYKPKMIWGHPTVLVILADYIIEKKYDPLEIPLIGTYGEKIHDHNRAILNKAFSTRFFEYYGNRENTISAWGDSNGKFYEVSEYCHLEPLNDPEAPRKDRNVPIISTSLHNYAVPMIRYDTGDIITWLGYESGSSSYPALELAGGRGKDLLLSAEGLMAPYIPPELDSLKHSKLKQYQLEQVEIDKLILRIAPLENFDKSVDESFLIKAFEKALLGRFKTTVEYVEEIPFTEGGKYRIAVSPLAKEYLKEKYSS